MEFESSDDDEPVKQQYVGMEAMQSAQISNTVISKLDQMTCDKLGEKEKLVKLEFVVPKFHLHTNIQNDIFLYVAPIVYMWDPRAS